MDMFRTGGDENDLKFAEAFYMPMPLYEINKYRERLMIYIYTHKISNQVKMLLQTVNIKFKE